MKDSKESIDRERQVMHTGVCERDETGAAAIILHHFHIRK